MSINLISPDICDQIRHQITHPARRQVSLIALKLQIREKKFLLCQAKWFQLNTQGYIITYQNIAHDDTKSITTLNLKTAQTWILLPEVYHTQIFKITNQKHITNTQNLPLYTISKSTTSRKCNVEVLFCHH